MSRSNYHHLEGCEVVAHTKLAILVRCEDLDEDEWFPRSIVSNGENFEKGDKDVTISIPKSWAKKIGLEVEDT